MDGGVALEPGKLLAGIATRVALYLEDGFVERCCPVEVLEEFFVADGVQGVEPAAWIHFSCFFDHSVLNHLQNTLVDAFVEFLAGKIQADFQDLEGTLFLSVGSERGVGLSGHVADFQCVYDAAGIVLVYDGPVFWI